MLRQIKGEKKWNKLYFYFNFLQLDLVKKIFWGRHAANGVSFYFEAHCTKKYSLQYFTKRFANAVQKSILFGYYSTNQSKLRNIKAKVAILLLWLNYKEDLSDGLLQHEWWNSKNMLAEGNVYSLRKIHFHWRIW